MDRTTRLTLIPPQLAFQGPGCLDLPQLALQGPGCLDLPQLALQGPGCLDLPQLVLQGPGCLDQGGPTPKQDQRHADRSQ